MKRQRARVKQLLEKARDSALLALEIYNKPRTAFKSGGFIVFMSIAWLSLFHAVFERDKVNYFYKKNRRYVMIENEKKAWELNKCVKEYYKDKNIPQRKNLEFFIKFRNRIEHRFLPQLDFDIFGECQAMLINFEEMLTKEFGDKYAINENLVFALQFSSILHEKQREAIKIKESKEYKKIENFIEKYRTNLNDSIKNSLNYSFRVFLIPKIVGSEKTSDVAIEFIKYDPAKPEEEKKYKKIVALIKEKQVPMVGFRAGQVCEKVKASLKDKMTFGWEFHPSTHHVKCWRYFKVRPPKGSSIPEKTDQKYCFYNSAFNQYEYTEEWIRFLVNKLSDKKIYKQVMMVK